MVYSPQSPNPADPLFDETSTAESPAYGSDLGNASGYAQRPLTIFGRSLNDYLYWALRYSWVIVLTTLAGVLYGLYSYSISPPVYQSRASIEFKRIKREAVDIDESEKLKLDASAHFASTLQKLKMPGLYENIVASPTFTDRNDVIPAKREWRWPWNIRRSTSGSGSASPEWLAAVMPGWIHVHQRDNTTIVDLTATHSSPEVCRDVLEQLLVEYENYIDGEVAGSEKYALQFLFEKSEDIEESIMASQSALDRYNECLKFDQLITATKDKIVQMRTRYRDLWPPLIEAQELIRLSAIEFNQELAHVLSASKTEAEYWQKQMDETRGTDDLIGKQQKILHSRVNLLEKQLVQQEAMQASLMSKISVADLSQGFEGKQFTIINAPNLPGGSIAPGRSAILTRTSIVGLTLGLGVVFLIGIFDTSIRSVNELENSARLPVVGVIPKLEVDSKSRHRPLFVSEDPNGIHSESIRSLRAALSMLGTSEDRATFLVTSSLPGEGKSVISANLAISFAQQGERTLIIDCDLRKPVQHRIFDLDPDAPGLSDYLTGKVELEDIMQRSAIDGLLVVAAGSRAPNPAELLCGSRVGEFIREMKVHFDRIIIDSAPILPVSDTVPLAREVQSVLLACRLGKTPRKALQHSMKTLALNRTLPAGLIANALPLPRNRLLYGYYYGYHGSAVYKDYRENNRTAGAERRRVQTRSRRSRQHRSDAHELLS